MKKISFLSVIPILGLFLPSLAFAIPVVPGAYGFGMDTRAAYGGSSPPVIYKVTSLADSGPGTLREAMEASVPRIVVFERSGTISLNSDILVRNPYLTVAGQTAPNPGITLRNYGIWIYSHDILLQHFRIRPGDGLGSLNNDDDGQGIRVGVYEGGAYNVVIDHMSVSWTNDEGTIVAKTNSADTGTSDANVTFWRNLIGESLNFSLRDPASEGKGFAVNYNSKKVAAIQNAYISAFNRAPLVKGGTSVYFANNLVYNWTNGVPATYSDFTDGDPLITFYASHIGNHYRTGPNWEPGTYMAGSRGIATPSQLYLADNFRDAVGGNLNEYLIINNEGSNPIVGSPPVTVSGYTPMSSASVMSSVLANAGARPADRDSVDARLVNNVINRNGSQISSQSEVGGWPTLAVNTRVFSTPANPNSISATGYTNLEDTLHTMAAAVEGGTVTPPQPPTPPPPPSSSGTKAPPASSITDASGNSWTIGASNIILRNGVQAGSGVGSIILYYLTNVFTLSTDNNWWQWNGSSWTSVGPNDPSVQAVSADGAEIPAVSQIIDNNHDTWTISGNNILRNGVQAGGGTGTILLWSNTNKIYTLSTDNAWWQWNGTNWTRLGTSKPNMGDLNKDHIVNSLDWSQMNSKWFSSDATADLNHDSVVNAIDFSLMNANWLKNW